MRVYTAISSLLLLVFLVTPCFAQEQPQPEAIVGNMATKFTRGITNIVTGPVEIPKQTITSIRDQGALGVVIGPLKGIGMTVYRVIIGSFEAAFCMVPQPGYYDPMVDPDYVWNGWEKQQPGDYVKVKNAEMPGPDEMQKGE
jgi:putative exosortase-associated protein (TIGR04073 family)